MFYTGDNNNYSAGQNLVGKKNVTIPMQIDVKQKLYGWHPDTPALIKNGVSIENARLIVGMELTDLNNLGNRWQDQYRCPGVIMEGYDKYASTHANAGVKASCLMNGSANAARVLSTEIANEWGVLEDVVAEFDMAAANNPTSPTTASGSKFVYLGFRPARPDDDPADIIGKAYQGKEAGSSTVPIWINTTA